MNEKDTEAAPQSGTSEATGGRRWYVWDIVLFGVFVALCMALFGVPSVLEYLQARRDGSASLDAIGAFMGLGVLVFIGPWILALRLFIAWPRHIRGFRRLALAWIVAIVGVVSLLAAFYEFWPAGYQFRLWGFRRYVQRRADIPAIQAWLETVDRHVCDGEWMAVATDVHGAASRASGEVNYPSFVLDLKPRYVQLSLDEANRPIVRLRWGSGLEGTWGLTVGREDMPIPKTQLPTRETLRGGQVFRNPGEDRLPLAGGVYVWHEIE